MNNVVAIATALFAISTGALAAEDRYAEAVAAADRLDTDRVRDAGRKPAQMLAFMGVEEGMEILDLYSGGGYYTELLSTLVGPDGRITAHNNTPYLSFVGEELDRRYTDGRLQNVDRIISENNELELDANRYDAIMLMLTYHDIYYVDPDNGWPELDGPRLLAELHQSLKAGGALFIADHAAAAGSPTTTGGTTHRIDPAIVVSEMEAAGFKLTDQADFLRNPDDDYAKSVFDPEIRGKSDRFVMRFEKR